MNELPPFTHPRLGPGLQGLTRYGELRPTAQAAVVERALAEGRAYVRPIDNDQNGPGEIRVESGTLSIRTKFEGSSLSFHTPKGRIDLPADQVGDAAFFRRLFGRGAN